MNDGDTPGSKVCALIWLWGTVWGLLRRNIKKSHEGGRVESGI